MAQNIINGSDLMLFDKQNKSLVSYAKDHSLSLSGTTSDVSSKDHGLWKSTQITGMEWSLSTNCLYTIESFDKLFDAFISRTPMDVTFTVKKETDPLKSVADGDYPNWTAGAAGYQGQVLITSLKGDASNAESGSISVEMIGVGSLKKRTATA